MSTLSITDITTTDAVTATLAYFDGWNRHDAEAIAAAVGGEFVYASDASAGPVRGPDGLRAFAGAFLSAFPDLRFEVRPATTSDGRVVAQWTVTGTHRAPLLGVPASGRRFTLHGCDVTEVADGRVRRIDAYWDSAALLRQLGAAPAGGEAGG
jgi:steroid delta-isomerase-like uncharacterized protein